MCICSFWLIMCARLCLLLCICWCYAMYISCWFCSFLFFLLLSWWRLFAFLIRNVFDTITENFYDMELPEISSIVLRNWRIKGMLAIVQCHFLNHEYFQLLVDFCSCHCCITLQLSCHFDFCKVFLRVTLAQVYTGIAWFELNSYRLTTRIRDCFSLLISSSIFAVQM